ncbi:MAG: hypothetical protein OEW58_12625 [Gammaproteobacteria bacterium]|nr:hypothetical protein [Gammaproteobacteria bacterium]
MYKSRRNHFIPSILVLGITLFAATACTTTKLVKDENKITIERVDSNTANISHVYLKHSDGQLLLRGEVKPHQSSRRTPIPGHLHITLIDPQGKMLKEADISYMRRSVNSSKAFFSTELPVDLPPGSTIKITHFERQTHEPIPVEPNWRDVQHPAFSAH